MSIPVLLGKIAQVIINPLVTLGFVIATAVFFYGVIQLIRKSDSDADRKKGQDAVLYGVIGLFVMFSVFGILHFVLNTFNLGNQYPDTLPQ